MFENKAIFFCRKLIPLVVIYVNFGIGKIKYSKSSGSVDFTAEIEYAERNLQLNRVNVFEISQRKNKDSSCRTAIPWPDLREAKKCS